MEDVARIADVPEHFEAQAFESWQLFSDADHFRPGRYRQPM